ncbi:ABC transporter [Haloferax sp. Atlit-10N]|uniref:ABC transporter n=1 Tax=Haloferax prahovense (strain DSM 18310 / JCM 13924 / TL6) TaxID=1227461 RepID=M0GEL1_HALPT|nr:MULTISPECIES: hypothetical protein [Haloferax]ELZ69259.1 hypothetical protein C457_09009 [Haloferax prahovense DSM 18310]RDZ42063.1 ABC transporter [Haloferax sp. Atlit-19N]RDZ42350.1 ABC transporter [Haloferax sp. Atlit-16N]RDZ57223.1 ABC transporter [Haloferax sp. Atlit-10N]
MSSEPAHSTSLGGTTTLVGLGRLLWEVIRKQFTVMLRYRVNFAINVATMYVFFAIVFFGGQAVVGGIGGSPQSLDSTLNGVIVGWFLWTMAQGAYSGLSGNITQESQWGTLEQLYMSPFGFGRVMLLKAASNVIQSMAIGGVILILMLVTTGRTLSVDLLTIVPVVTASLLSVVGIGFVFAGLALIYKRIGAVSNLMQFAMVGLVGAPTADVPLLRLLPLVQGSALLQQSMRHGIRLWEFSAEELSVLLGVGVGYLVCGYVVFKYCSRVARRRGVMGHY